MHDTIHIYLDEIKKQFSSGHRDEGLTLDSKSTEVKRLREKLGLSQEKLARLADVSNNTIVNIESGKQQNPTVDTIKKISKALNVSIEELIK